MIKRYGRMLKNEFSGYNLARFSKDVLAGLTVAAVALPLALAFGVASGADAAAGLITAIMAGLITGILSGASYQISGPTGAMTAVLITIVATYQMQGVFLACLMAGVILLVAGLFRLGKLIQFIPRPVVTGFTSGIAIIIALGQIDNFFGTTSVGSNTFEKIASYFTNGFHPNWQSVLCGVIVIVIMATFPKKWNSKVPSSLISIIIVGLISYLAKFDVATVGEIPRRLIHSTRLDFSEITLGMFVDLLSPAFTIAALGMVESLLCGTCAANMKKEAFDADQELVAQGIGNMLLPFFGGVPSTAAIARTSVAIKSGGQTRLTSIFQSVWLILCMFLLAPVMAKLPLAALAGVLMMTAFRMNEWGTIKYFFKNKMWGAISKFTITMVATVVFDLTIAIAIGVIYALFLMVYRMSKIEIETSKVDNKKLLGRHKNVDKENEKTVVVYVTGALFFANADTLKRKLSELNSTYDKFIIVMRGVMYMDVSAGQSLLECFKDELLLGKELCFTGTRPQVLKIVKMSGIEELIGANHFYETVDKVLLSEGRDLSFANLNTVDEQELEKPAPGPTISKNS